MGRLIRSVDVRQVALVTGPDDLVAFAAMGRPGATAAAVRRAPDPVGTPADPWETAGGLGVALRVPVFTALTLVLAAAAHVAAGGSLPGPGHLAFAAAATASMWWPLARHQVPWWRLALGVGVVQVGVHLVLLDAGGGPVHPSGGGHEHTLTWPMVAGHVLAAALVAGWLTRGEAAAWAAVRRVLPRLPLAPATPAVRAPLPRPVPAPRTCTARSLRSPGDPRRGPPAPATARA
jgi:hypothetical protein